MNIRLLYIIIASIVPNLSFTYIIEFEHYFNTTNGKNLYFFLTVYDPTEVGGSFQIEYEKSNIEPVSPMLYPRAGMEDVHNPYQSEKSEVPSSKIKNVKIAKSVKQGESIIKFIASLKAPKKIILEQLTQDYFQDLTKKNVESIIKFPERFNDLDYLDYMIHFTTNKPEDRENSIKLADYLFRRRELYDVITSVECRGDKKSLMYALKQLEGYNDSPSLNTFYRKVLKSHKNGIRNQSRLAPAFFDVIEARILHAVYQASERNIVVIMDQAHFAAIRGLVLGMGYIQVNKVGINASLLKTIRDDMVREAKSLDMYWSKLLSDPKQLKKQLNFSYKKLLKRYESAIKFDFSSVKATTGALPSKM